MNIFVISRQNLDKIIFSKKIFLNGESFAVISITSIGIESPGIKKKLLSEHKRILSSLGMNQILQLEFNDTSPDEKRIAEDELFTIGQAKQIIEFAKKSSANNLIIHCDAGVSRSGAVGLWATRFLNQDENEFKEKHPQIAPNPFVLGILMEESGLNAEYMKIWLNEMKEKTPIVNRNEFFKRG